MQSDINKSIEKLLKAVTIIKQLFRSYKHVPFCPFYNLIISSVEARPKRTRFFICLLMMVLASVAAMRRVQGGTKKARICASSPDSYSALPRYL